MKTREQIELENMALGVELARQLCHDFSNFVYNLTLQFEIWTTLPTSPQPSDWVRLKQESNKIVRLLRDWRQFHNQWLDTENKTADVREITKEVAAEVLAGHAGLQIALSLSEAPLMFIGSSVGVQHLLRLLVEDVLQTWKESTGSLPTLSMQTNPADAKNVVRIVAEPVQGGTPLGKQGAPREHTLVEATCHSLAVRLDVVVRHERQPEGAGSYVLEVEFPPAAPTEATL